MRRHGQITELLLTTELKQKEWQVRKVEKWAKMGGGMFDDEMQHMLAGILLEVAALQVLLDDKEQGHETLKRCLVMEGPSTYLNEFGGRLGSVRAPFGLRSGCVRGPYMHGDCTASVQGPHGIRTGSVRGP